MFFAHPNHIQRLIVTHVVCLHFLFSTSNTRRLQQRPPPHPPKRQHPTIRFLLLLTSLNMSTPPLSQILRVTLQAIILVTLPSFFSASAIVWFISHYSMLLYFHVEHILFFTLHRLCLKLWTGTRRRGDIVKSELEIGILAKEIPYSNGLICITFSSIRIQPNIYA